MSRETKPPEFGMPRDLAHSWRNLTALVDRYAEAQGVPCRGGAVPVELFTSDREVDQARAALECKRCPALIACRRYGLQNPKEAGVYGGLTESVRRTTAKERTRK